MYDVIYLWSELIGHGGDCDCAGCVCDRCGDYWVARDLDGMIWCPYCDTDPEAGL